MSKKEVERLLIAGAENKPMRLAYDKLESMDDFIAKATEDGFEFTADELKEVLRESGDTFESSGNPRKRDIWWF